MILAATCVDFSGRYRDNEHTLIEIKQNKCSHIQFISNDKKTDIILDSVSRSHEKSGEKTSFISAKLTQQQLILEQMIYGTKITPADYIYKTILTYYFKNETTLIEDTKLYNQINKLIDYKTMELLKIKSAN